MIDGQRLRGDTTRVLIDEEEIVPNDDDVTAARIVIALPATLQPGLHSVQVAHRVDFETGLPSDPHRGVESNVAAFVLSPEITTPAPIAAARNTTLTLTIDPPVGRAQRARCSSAAARFPFQRGRRRVPPLPPRSIFRFRLIFRRNDCSGSRSTARKARSRSMAPDNSMVRPSRSHESAKRNAEDWAQANQRG